MARAAAAAAAATAAGAAARLVRQSVRLVERRPATPAPGRSGLSRLGPRAQLKHDPERWIPVVGRDDARAFDRENGMRVGAAVAANATLVWGVVVAGSLAGAAEFRLAEVRSLGAAGQ